MGRDRQGREQLAAVLGKPAAARLPFPCSSSQQEPAKNVSEGPIMTWERKKAREAKRSAKVGPFLLMHSAKNLALTVSPG
jgi:hypothetical protein